MAMARSLPPVRRRTTPTRPMPRGELGAPTGIVDLRGVHLIPGTGVCVAVPLPLDAIRIGGEDYAPHPPEVVAEIDVGSSGSGLVLRLRFATTLRGPCQRCLGDASFDVDVDAEIVQTPPRGGAVRSADDPDTAYLVGPAQMDLDVPAWARDAIAEIVPMSVVCRAECKGLCAGCGHDLNDMPCACVDDDRDPRWAALSALADQTRGKRDDHQS